jgi:DNA-binding NtrC family response regulator
MARVLLVSYIPEFLQQRERTFLAAGYEAGAALSFEIASAAIEHDHFDVAVMGFCVPAEERNQLARALKQANPASKVIMIYFASTENTELADALMQTTATPEEMVRAVNHLLNQQDQSRTG